MPQIADRVSQITARSVIYGISKVAWYFSSSNKSIDSCVHRAYRDFCRQLTGLGAIPGRESWRETLESGLIESIKKLLNSLPKNQNEYDKWHDDVCKYLMENSKNSSGDLSAVFTYGIAQKWVNMSLKNMLIQECESWELELSRLEQFLHVPVDSYIMQGASDDGVDIMNKRGHISKYSESYSKPWSKWDRCDYMDFQKRIRHMVIDSQKYSSPIDWEYPTWVRVAKERKAKQRVWYGKRGNPKWN